MYWIAKCKNPECPKWLLASYIGYVNPHQMFAVPVGVHDYYEVPCDHCGKLYRYGADQLFALRQLGPPDEKWVPWF